VGYILIVANKAVLIRQRNPVMFAVYYYSPENLESQWPTIVSIHATASGADKSRDSWIREGLACDVMILAPIFD
jgi:hypothetical protein